MSARVKRSANRDHPAADVHADRCGNNGAFGGEHGSDGGAFAVVAVGHDGNMLEHERHAGCVKNLLLRFALDRAPGEEDDSLVAHLRHAHVGFFLVFLGDVGTRGVTVPRPYQCDAIRVPARCSIRSAATQAQPEPVIVLAVAARDGSGAW